jgi:hypothetical protein
MAITNVRILGWTTNLNSTTKEVSGFAVKYETLDESDAIVRSNLILSVPVTEVNDFDDEITNVAGLGLGKTNIQAYTADFKLYLREKALRREGLK